MEKLCISLFTVHFSCFEKVEYAICGSFCVSRCAEQTHTLKNVLTTDRLAESGLI